MFRLKITLRDDLGETVATGDHMEMDGAGVLTVTLGGATTTRLDPSLWAGITQYSEAVAEPAATNTQPPAPVPDSHVFVPDPEEPAFSETVEALGGAS